MEETEPKGLQRREFLRRAAIAGAAAWAVPVVRTIAATPAFAATQGTPQKACFHSNNDPSQSCMDACTSFPCTGKQCDGFGNDKVPGPCGELCHIGPGNSCCNAGLCNPANFTCPSNADDPAIYSGPLTGC